MKTCDICKGVISQRVSTPDKLYHDRECGLSDVYLIGVKVYSCPTCGIEIADIPNTEGLHLLLAREILKKPVAMTGEEFRFLRKETLKTPREFGGMIGVDPKTIKTWESLPSLSRQNDLLIRFVVATLLREIHQQAVDMDIAFPSDLMRHEWALEPDVQDLVGMNTALRLTDEGWTENSGSIS